jgi:hypothetical protein
MKEIINMNSLRLQITMLLVAVGMNAEVFADSLTLLASSQAGAVTAVSTPEELVSAVESAKSGSIIYIRGGTYYFDKTITLDRSGNKSKMITLSKHPNEERPLFDFSAMSENSRNRGLELQGDYWQIYGIDVRRAGDNCLNVTGSNNVVEFSTFQNAPIPAYSLRMAQAII